MDFPPFVFSLFCTHEDKIKIEKIESNEESNCCQDGMLQHWKAWGYFDEVV